jgi:hypothetical protein
LSKRQQGDGHAAPRRASDRGGLLVLMLPAGAGAWRACAVLRAGRRRTERQRAAATLRRISCVGRCWHDAFPAAAWCRAGRTPGWTAWRAQAHATDRRGAAAWTDAALTLCGCCARTLNASRFARRAGSAAGAGTAPHLQHVCRAAAGAMLRRCSASAANPSCLLTDASIDVD